MTMDKWWSAGDIARAAVRKARTPCTVTVTKGERAILTAVNGRTCVIGWTIDYFNMEPVNLRIRGEQIDGAPVGTVFRPADIELWAIPILVAWIKENDGRE